MADLKSLAEAIGVLLIMALVFAAVMAATAGVYALTGLIWAAGAVVVIGGLGFGLFSMWLVGKALRVPTVRRSR